MPYNQLKDTVWKFYGAALQLRSLILPEPRMLLYRNFVFASMFLFLLAVIFFAIQYSTIGSFPGIQYVELLSDRVWGLFLVIFSVAFVLSSLEALHRSFYFKGLQHVLHDTNDPVHMPVSWEVATIVFETTDNDITGGFMSSTYGQEILYRVGITEHAYELFDAQRTPTLTSEGFIIEKDKGVILSTYARSVYKQDTDFRQFLSQNNINEEQLINASLWVTRIERSERIKKRWWAKDNLGRIPGLGKTWSYGETYLLKKYGHDMVEDSIWPSAMMTRREEDDEVEELETILSRNRDSNAILLTNDVLQARRRTAQLYHKIREGRALPLLEDKKVFVIDIETVLIASNEKALFENNIRKLLNQAVLSGNSIVYIENIHATVESALTLGVDLIEMMRDYFSSSGIQIVIGELSENFDKHISKDSRIMQAFDVVQMNDVKDNGVLELLEQRATKHEKYTDIVFTVPALDKITELADRYFPTGVMPDKAFDLLEELVPVALSNNFSQILQSDVEELVTRKTHVPVGEPDEQERDKLLNLEAVLHKRVVAQEDAIQAVSKALRRARAGVGNPNKPMGSFLFLGPTGVGKTETAKSLAEALFDDENAMSRIDMSEFQHDEALDELIGSSATGQTGRLETLIRKRQYGVLLLDEFEKSSKTVHDLFLQILDEGRFTSGDGKRVNLRNLVIIATSNAGADLIWEWEKENKDLSYMKRTLIDEIIKRSLFRPELLNRFDDIIVFKVLTEDQVKEIAKIQLKNFAKRLYKDRQIKLDITDELIERVVAKGYDPQFGGRPMNRAIQEEVEQTIADTILAGTLHSGDVVAFHDPEQAKHLAIEELEKLASKLKAENKITLAITEELADYIVSKGYNPDAVAGSVRDAVREHAEMFVETALKEGKLKEGDILEYRAK